MAKTKSLNALRRSRGDGLLDAILATILILIFLVVLYPFLNIFATSVSTDNAILRGAVTFYPQGFELTAYTRLVGSLSVMRSFANTTVVAVIGGVFSVLMTMLAAYPMAFSDFIGKKAYTLFVLLPMWFSAGIVPTYMVVKSLGLTNTLWALVVVVLISPYHVIVLNSFMRSLPSEVCESARIDGANDIRILFQIIAPLCKASIATISLWVVVAHWNDFMNPLMYLTDTSKFTMQLVLRDIVINAENAMYDLGGAAGDGGVAALSIQMKNAMLGISILPMLIFYPFIQKYFVTGVMIGSVKG